MYRVDTSARYAASRAIASRLPSAGTSALRRCYLVKYHYGAPATATYHLHQLAAADLINREKSGPSVRVSRTDRGHELVDLLSD